MKKLLGITLIVVSIVLLWSSNKQESLPLPPPDNEEEEVVDFETWFKRHHVECDTCEPGWPPRLCSEAWNKLEIMRACPQDLMMLHKGVKND